MASKEKNKPQMPLTDDPFREESTDFRAPGEKFEIMPEGENLDLSRMDQPRTNLDSLPKAHKQKARVPVGKKEDDRPLEKRSPQKRVA